MSTLDVIETVHGELNTANEKQGYSLQQCVEQTLSNYFAQLGNQQAANLYKMVIEQVEDPLLRSVMAHTRNNQSQAAKILGLSRGTLRKKLKIYDMLD